MWCVEVWYENICECSKIRNRPVVYSRHEFGASMYFEHISSFLDFAVVSGKLAVTHVLTPCAV